MNDSESLNAGGLGIRGLAAAQVCVEGIGNETSEYELQDEDFHHLSKVLRLRQGETVIATDGAGSWQTCLWSGTKSIETAGEVELRQRDLPLISVGFALTKGDKPEWTVQKLTELGVDVIVPFVSERTVVQWDDTKRTKNLIRYRKVAYDAAMQSRRVWMPEIRGIVRLSELEISRCAFAVPGGARLELDERTVLIGPEGGFTESELANATRTVGLGPTMLRAETAAVAVGVRLCALREERRK